MAPGAITEDATRNESVDIRIQQIAAIKAGVASNQPRGPRLTHWDSGLFESELVLNDVTPRALPVKAGEKHDNLIVSDKDDPDPVIRGSFAGTQKALTEIYKRTEDSFAAYFDVANFETSIPRPVALEEKRQIYTYQKPWSDNYPPHLNLIPPKDEVPLTTIFNKMRLLDTSSLLTQLVPDFVYDFIHSDPEADTLDGITKRNQELRAQKKDVFSEPNIGDRDDWYTDRIYAQQMFTGTNPMTIEAIDDKLLDEFKQAAHSQKNNGVISLLEDANARANLFVQDYSYFREAVEIAPTAPLMSNKDTNWLRRIEGIFSSEVRNDDAVRYLSAPVVLLILDKDAEGKEGQLHPLAICIDYRGSMAHSVTIFNTKVTPSSNVPNYDESVNWPWRYAKLAAQAADWTRHELTVHLTNTHFVEEATIVASQRCFDDSHPVYALLKPHWLRTLSLNAGARSVLVPSVISKISGIETGQVNLFIKHAYRRFDWVANYVPNDLARRGFPLTEIEAADKSNSRFRKYTYARNMLEMWTSLRDFVSQMLSIDYTSDATVAGDRCVQDWATEMRANYGGNLASFPASFKTLGELIDAVTMCIHLASPQHTSINYLQDYYQSFVVNRPPCLCSPPPTSLKELLKYQEADIMKALPVNAPRTWLLASHLPYLLSYKVAQDQNLVTYAKSLQVLAGQKVKGAKNGKPEERDVKTKTAADGLLNALVKMSSDFALRSNELENEGEVRYDVMDPVMTAVSILI
ncbi:60S ribosomal protein L26-2 [Sphaceloma murrayae]|uniref:Manganese lipoxygenase n=1 Tax=Sphaceloma murrayae TaxID=2082308 RepID=A0A2K1QYJ3_9PEZI|nr:60S ribosomal protein L26-2 [Sphaceloma murrayae]